MAARASRKRGREEAALEAPDEPVLLQQPGEFLECPICTDVLSPLTQPLAHRPLTLCLYQVFSEASVLACGHTFCQQCIVSAMGEKRECPMCRAAQPPRKRYSASLSFCRWFSKRGAG